MFWRKITLERRLIIAMCISAACHLAVYVLVAGRYKPVADFAIPFEVVDAARYEDAPPFAGAPMEEDNEPPPPPPAKPKIAPKAPPAEPGPSKEKKFDPPKTPPPAEPVDTDPDTDAVVSDSDTHPVVVAGVGSGDTDSAAIKDGAICMPDLFPLTRGKPSWLFWVSLASFRETFYAAGLKRAILAFELAAQLTQATGMHPVNDLDGLMVVARDVFDEKSYQVIARHRFGLEEMRDRVDARRKRGAGFTWSLTKDGYRGSDPRGYTWELAGMTRLLRISSQQAPRAALAPKKLEDNPYGEADEPAVGETAPMPEGGRGLNSEDLREHKLSVRCLAPARGPWPLELQRRTKRGLDLSRVTKSFLVPDDEGHMPTAIIATSDSVTLGLPRELVGLGLTFEYGVAVLTFGSPIKLSGAIYFEGDPAALAQLSALWQEQKRRAADARLLKLFNLDDLVRDLRIATRGNRVSFELSLSETQVRALLVLLGNQARIVDQRLKRR